MLTALLVIGSIAALLGAILGWASVRFRVEGDPLVDQIDAILPQTQCGQCGYPGCRPYAEAIAKGEADINRCPPGGDEGVRRLADLLGREYKPLEAEEAANKPPSVAVIDESRCIGCTLCIQACPVDAIIGSSKQMHTVIDALCTGCELCVAPCPVECITMAPIPLSWENWKWPKPGEKAQKPLLASLPQQRAADDAVSAEERGATATSSLVSVVEEESR